MNDTQLFAFESDFVATLRCVPMAVRFKLDRCGIKLSLRQWSRFTRDDRQALLMRPCDSEAETAAYRAALVALVALRANEVAKPLAEPPCGKWDVAREVAPAVTRYARALGVQPPSPDEWASLSTLQRFVLIKLTRDNHDNVNFIPAMQEFGLVKPAISPACNPSTATGGRQEWPTPSKCPPLATVSLIATCET